MPLKEDISIIIQIGKVSLPKLLWWKSYDVCTYIDDFRPRYSLVLRGWENSKLLEEVIDSFERNGILDVKISGNSLDFIRNYKKLNYVKDLQINQLNPENKSEKDIIDYANFWKLLFTKNIYDLRIESTITDDWFIDLLLNYLRADNNSGSQLKINDLEINLENGTDPKQFLKALEHNYMIKTVKLITPKHVKVDSSTERLAEKFRNKRIATEIGLNCDNKRFRISQKKNSLKYFILMQYS